jgi:hypothetical protein
MKPLVIETQLSNSYEAAKSPFILFGSCSLAQEMLAKGVITS